LTPPLQPGTHARTRLIYPFPLPRGLPVGSEVVVKSVEAGVCVVSDGEDRLWSVPVVALDPGSLVWVDGRWVAEEEETRQA
jgi:hypothetical protein